MNKNRYRIIFNKARGVRMAVAETTRSQGQAGGETRPSSKINARTLIAEITPLAFFLWGLLGMVMIPATHAQIVADPTAADNQRPTVLNAPNNVPLVNIQTPSAAGVSRNTYRQFDVQQQGAILNNSRTNVQTQLGGWVQGNPWLANGSARVILNEVNSSDPSLLRGYMEVAGQRAQIVIANPAGVTCDGCGFINANRATITTGTLIMNSGNLEGFRVQGGTVTITGNGMDARTTDYTDIIARSVQLNAGVWANQLNVVTGTNQFSLDPTAQTPSVSGASVGTGAIPRFAIDTAQLGGMYAGKIILLATEAGVGVRNAGNMYAGVGDVIITASGQMQNTGIVYAHTNTTITTRGDIDNSGVIAAQSNTGLSATGAGSQITNRLGAVLAAGVQADGTLGLSGNLTVSATQSISAQGKNLSGGDQSFAAQDIDLSGSQTSTRNLSVTASSGDIHLANATVDVSQTWTASASQTLRSDDAQISAHQIHVSARDLSNRRGEIVQTGSDIATITVSNKLDNTAGAIASNGSIRLSVGALKNQGGEIQAAGPTPSHLTVIAAEEIDNSHGGILSASGNATIASSILDNTQGQIIAGQALIAATTQSVRNTQGLIAANGPVSVSASEVINQNGAIASVHDAVSVTARNGSLDNTSGRIEATKTTTLSAVDINNIDGTILGKGLIADSQGQIFNNTRGQLISIGTAATDALNIQSGDLDNHAGYIGSVAALAIKSRDVTNTQGTLIAGQQLTIDSAGLSGDGEVLSQGDLAIKLHQSFTNTGQIIANGNATLETDATLTNQGTLAAGNTLNAKAATIDNQAGGVMSARNVKLQATGSATLTNRGTINGTETVIQTQTLRNLGTGRIYGDHVAIGATTVVNTAENGTAAVIAARDRLDIGADTILNSENAILFSGGDLAIGGRLDPNKQATGQATTLNNNSATIEATGHADINVKTINNTNQNFSTTTETLPAQQIVEYQGSGSPNRYAAGTPDVYIYNDESDHLHTPEGNHEIWSAYNYTRNVTETRVASSDPAQILSGGAMRITADIVNNDKSHIIAGGTLTGTIGTLTNTEVAGERVTTDSGSVASYWRSNQKGRDSTGSSSADYRPASSIQSISLTPTVYQQNTAASGSGIRVAALSTATVNQTPGAASSATGAAQGGQAVTPIAQVVAATSSAAGPSVVVRSGGINTRVPNNSLFGLAPSSTAKYLIETDPAFANYRNWLSSDYLLTALSLDPALTQKRLGDGFYEQKLIREQVAQLTGRRFLEGYADDEAQYAALMASGAAYAQAHHLVPGVALSAAQMAQLTHDIVWLVEKEITLANGTTTRALVPQLYVHVQEGDLQAGGALIAGNNISLHITGNLLNGGTIAGRQLVSLTAENLDNLGGRILGNDVGVFAGTDLNNIGGTIAANRNLIARAGRDLTVASTTRTQTSAQGSQTNIQRVAGLYVTGSSGTLLASAGRDVHLIAAAIENHGSGDTTITAGNNVNLGTVTQSQSRQMVWDGNNRRSDSSQVDVGTRFQTQGNLTLQAGNDLNAKAATVTSAQGDLVAIAGNNIHLIAGQANVQVDEAHQHKGRSSALSSKTVTTRDTLDQTTAQATILSGKTATVLAERDINLTGSAVVGDGDTTLSAKNNLTISATTNTTSEGHFRDEKRSGIFSGGGVGITIGTQQRSTDQKIISTTAEASVVGSTQGDVNLSAGKRYAQTGSDVMAPQGDVNIFAQTIDIQEARETSQNQIESQFKQSGVTVAVTSPVISAIQTAQQMSKAARETNDPRMKALAAANIAFAGKKAADAIKAGQGTTINGQEHQIPTEIDADGKVIQSRDANAADKVGGINLALSIGGSKSQSKTEQSSDSTRESTVTAGNNLSITARGAGQDSDITAQGSKLQAGNVIALNAEDEIRLAAARNSADQKSSNSSKSGSIGISIGTDGLLVTANASSTRGNADGTDVTWTNTQVIAGHQVALTSAGDTSVQGAVVKAPQIRANVGGNLNVESLQDTSQFSSQQRSIGGSLSIGSAKVGSSLSAGKSQVQSDFASVAEQSGFRAGDGGFQVNVAGNTDLKGGAITSTQKAIDDNKNTFTTGDTVTTSDIQNQASYKASSVGVNIGTGVSLDGKLAPQGTGIGVGQDSGNAGSTTLASISGVTGNKEARTGDAERGIQKIFDADKVQKDVSAQVLITQTFGREASKAVAYYAARKIDEIKAEQAKQTDPEKRQALKTEQQKWEEGGLYRVALHAAVGGLAGGAPGAAGAGAASAAAPTLNDLQDTIAKGLENAGVPSPVAKATAQLITGTTAAGIGAMASGGSVAGAAAAFNADANNRQLHWTEAQKLASLKKGKSPEEQRRFDAAACALVRCADGVPANDPSYAQLQAMQQQGQGYQNEQIALLKTGEFVYQPYLDAARDVITRHGEAQQRIGGAVDLLAGSAGTVGGGAIAAAGAAGCAPSLGASCALVPLGAYLAIVSGQQAQEGNKALLGSYQSKEGSRVLASLDPATYPGERDPLKEIGVDAAKLGLTVVAGQLIPKALAKAEGLGGAASQGAGPGKVGADGGGNPTHLNELTANGVKFTPENVIATARTPSGQVVFLETGNSRAGLKHIVGEHANDFANIGVSQAEIPTVVMQAVSQGKIVGYQGVGTGRPIFETVINGQTRRLAITISNNGFIVGANPKGSVK